ncbi:uncharacterized protein [Diadema antillarum]|uniref:uncharacterized protein n=1 Tax=Diadema antillarum TaxID=105358 RepID=UPI003A8BA5C3
MGKSQSKPGSSWSWSYKRRENPEGDSYILRGCINTRFRDSEENLWMAEGSSDPAPASCKNGHGTQCGSHGFDGRQAERPVGLRGDLCSLKVALPPEVTGSRCSLKVQAMPDHSSSPGKKPCPPSPSDIGHGGTIGAVDCDVSLDAEKETQEWAFTLYDFDGHRRITREDLSSILKSISEALACSVILPPSGSRKLKLRLSVVSDQESDVNAGEGGGSGGGRTTNQPSPASQPSNPSHDNLSHYRTASTHSTSLPSTTSPLAYTTASPLFVGKQENKENALNRARDRPRENLEDIPACHRHSFNVNHQCWRKDEKRSRRARNRGRSQSMAAADMTIPYGEQVILERQHRKARKSSATQETIKDPSGTAKQTNNAGTNSGSTERPQENAERRSYYQELAGIDNQCTSPSAEEISGRPNEGPEVDLPLGASAGSRTSGGHRHSKSSPHHHRRSKSYEPQLHGDGVSGKKQPPPINQESFAKYEYAQRNHKDYHMQLLEASRTRLEGLQPHFEVQAAKQSHCRHSVKRHSFPAPVQVVTTQVIAPQVQPQGAAIRGKHRRRSRRHHTLQPLTVMKHEVMEKTEGVVYSPVTHKHQHHHHHEHHHHHHYHHYHDIE